MTRFALGRGLLMGGFLLPLAVKLRDPALSV
jgi:hypothetical protein